MGKMLTLVILFFAMTLVADEVRVSGEVYVNGKKADNKSVVKLGDFIKTKKHSKIKFNIGKDAFMAKENTAFSISENGGIKSLNVVTGGVLAVFEKGGGNHQVKTENMTAGIRGTGVFVEKYEKKTYFCTCYGKTELITEKEDKNYTSKHHHMLWIKANGSVKDAKKMEGHNDEELRELEAFVGRIPEFDMK